MQASESEHLRPVLSGSVRDSHVTSGPPWPQSTVADQALSLRMRPRRNDRKPYRHQPADEQLGVAHIVRHTGYQVCRAQPGRLC
jgi:hypothetical protein